MTPDRPEGVWGEIERLRNWRHDDVEPALRALDHLKDALESLVGSQAAIERRLTKVEEDVRSLAESEKLGRAVAAAMQKQHGGILTRRQRIVGYAVALAAVVGVVIQIAHYFS